MDVDTCCVRRYLRRGHRSVMKKGVGDLIEAAVHPIAVAFHLPCLNADGTLKKHSRCAKRRDKLNAAFWRFGIGVDSPWVTPAKKDKDHAQP